MIDSVLRVSSPDGVAFTLHPAGISARVLAFVIDTIIEIIGYIIFLIILSVLKVTGQWIFMLVFFCLQWFYFVILEIALKGRSPGKMVLGLQVVLLDGSPITIGASLLRNLLRAFDFLFAIGFLIPLGNNGFRRLGDMVAGTLVVYTPDRLSRSRQKLDLDGIEPRPPEHILGAEAADVVLAYARRRKGFSPALRQELSKDAAAVYLLNTEPEAAENASLAVAAWYAGIRPKQSNGGS